MIQTRQREAIYTVLQEAGRPLSREEILRMGRQKVARLGPATVNRAIRELSESFQIVGVEFPGQPRRYELPAGGEHPHFICRACNRVFDLPFAMQLPPVPAPRGFVVKGGEIIYSGECPDCSTKSDAR
ncbi:MAG: Fur family transcriptional regulator [Opitutales bacterium]